LAEYHPTVLEDLSGHGVHAVRLVVHDLANSALYDLD
jgi:hypothetical protein